LHAEIGAGGRRRVYQIDHMGSDHFPIIVSANEVQFDSSIKISRWNYNKADWAKFKNQLININPDLIENEDIDVYYGNLIKIITQAATTSIPKANGIPKKLAVQWWTNQIKQTRKDR